MKIEDPTIAGLLKNHGYVTGQFGKNHLGDTDDTLPTNHGFEEFIGYLYHLNAEEEPEHVDYPKEAEFASFKKDFGSRGVIHSFAGGTITDTGPLTKKRMETIGEEVNVKAIDFMERAAKDDKPFFIWWNNTPMHILTHLKSESVGKTGLCIYADGMVEHDGHVGQMLDTLKEPGLGENTIIMYPSDNGAEVFTWPGGGTATFRGERDMPYEGGYRVPCKIKWPGTIKPGTVANDIGALEDILTTILAAAGDTTLKGELLTGRTIGDRSYKVHLDGYDLGPALKGAGAWRRREFLCRTDDGSVAAVRFGNRKASFLKQDDHGFHVWQQPFEEPRVPILVNLRMDPFELAPDISVVYPRWFLERMYMNAPAAAGVGKWIQGFKEFPPRQKPGTFNLDRVMEAVTALNGG